MRVHGADSKRRKADQHLPYKLTVGTCAYILELLVRFQVSKYADLA